jgi:hypothetical protein
MTSSQVGSFGPWCGHCCFIFPGPSLRLSREISHREVVISNLEIQSWGLGLDSHILACPRLGLESDFGFSVMCTVFQFVRFPNFKFGSKKKGLDHFPFQVIVRDLRPHPSSRSWVLIKYEISGPDHSPKSSV